MDKAPFYKTVEIFSGVTGKRLRLKFDKVVAPSTDGTTIILPPRLPFSGEPRDLYTSLEHELSHIVFRSDSRNLLKFMREHEKYGVFLPRAVYNFVEDHRVDSLWSRIYAGSANFMRSLALRALNKGVSTPLAALMAARFGFWDLIPQKFKPLAERLVPLIKLVEGKGPAATYVVASQILPIIAPYYLLPTPPPQPIQDTGDRSTQDEALKTGAKPEAKEGGRVEPQTEPQKTGVKPEAKEVEMEASKSEGKPETAPETTSQKKEASKIEASMDRRFTEIEKDMEEVINYTDETGWIIKTEEVEVKGDPDEVLKKAEEEGRRMVEKVKRRLHVPVPRRRADEDIVGRVITEDVFGRTDEPEEADRAVARSLRSAFLRIKGKAASTEEDSGIDIDLDNYIQRRAGKDGNIPPFVAEELKTGLNVALLLDCSGSMTRTYNTPYRALDHAKKVILTLFEAIKGLPNVNLEVYGFSGYNENDLVTPVVRLTPERIAVLDVSYRYEYTHTHRAIQYVTNVLSRKLGKKLLILVTDGVPEAACTKHQVMAALTASAVHRARRKGVEVFVIRVGEKVDTDAMRAIYGPDKYWVAVPDFQTAGKVLINQVGKKIVSMLYQR